jgi:hypothetical protein
MAWHLNEDGSTGGKISWHAAQLLNTPVVKVSLSQGEKMEPLEAGWLVKAYSGANYLLCLVLDDSSRELYGKVLASISTGTQYTPAEFDRVEVLGWASMFVEVS